MCINPQSEISTIVSLHPANNVEALKTQMYLRVNSNNKLSKNFDERPHHPCDCHHAAVESVLEPRFGRDALSPANMSSAPCCRGVWCIHSPMYFNGGNNPLKLPLSLGDPDPPSSRWFFGTPESITQTACRSVHPFLQGLQL